MADYVVGRAAWLGNGGSGPRPKHLVDGRGKIDCPKCGAWWIQFLRDPSKPDTCRTCGADCSDKSDEWPEQLQD